MDSLTQIVLGAAVGEAVLGKKVGNRAIIWGGIAGTIPDLDVIANAFMTPIEALAVHRGISHALIFSIFAAPIFAWLTHQFYKQEVYKQQTYKTSISCLLITVFVSFFGSMIYFAVLGSFFQILLILLFLGSGYFLFKRIWQYWKLPLQTIEIKSANIKDWTLLFSLGFLTHTLLDACTPFGTQLLAPFADTRFAFNMIAVVDPIYTIPFITCLIIASFYHESSKKRAIFNWLGIGLSSAYLIFTFFNQHRMENNFKALLTDRNIDYQRVSVLPTIFNNVLWQCVAETDSNYLFTNYSVFDVDLERIKLVPIKKNHELLADFSGEKEVEILKWFSKGYYNIKKNDDGSLIYNDLKMAVIPEDIMGELTFGMNFKIKESASGIKITKGERPSNFPEGWFGRFWARLKGYK